MQAIIHALHMVEFTILSFFWSKKIIFQAPLNFGQFRTCDTFYMRQAWPVSKFIVGVLYSQSPVTDAPAIDPHYSLGPFTVFGVGTQT